MGRGRRGGQCCVVGVQAYGNVHARSRAYTDTLAQGVFHPGLHFILPSHIQTGGSSFAVRRVLRGGGGVGQEGLLCPAWRSGLTLKCFSAIRLIFPGSQTDFSIHLGKAAFHHGRKFSLK